MITFLTILGPDDRRLVQQALTHPVVYLDTWAIRLFSEEDPALGHRFRTALRRAGGTLMLSHLSVGEFTFDDPRHTFLAGQYVDTLLPHVFFSMFDVFKVKDRELRLLAGQRQGTPAGDEEMLTLYANATEQRGGRESVLEWFRWMHTDRANIAARRVEMAQSFIDGFNQLRQRFQTEPEFAKVAMRSIRAAKHPRATDALMQALLYRLRLDSKLQLTTNDAIDIGHSIVPAAYGDFVLVDRGWQLRLQDAVRLLRGCGIQTRIAEFYTRRDNGVLRFLEKLESWPPAAAGRAATDSGRQAAPAVDTPTP
jgi:hypothetical protein